MSIKIEMLRCFSATAQAGNLTDAAARLGRTQSALSMTLKQLEDHLGQPLFESGRKNRLTALGKEVFALAQQQLRQFDETINAIETTARAPRGLLRIASIPSVASLVYPTAVADLIRRHPGLQVELRDTDTDQVIDALMRGQADLGIASGQPVLNGISRTTLFEDAFGLVCARDHPLAVGEEEPGIEDILEAGFLLNNLCRQIRTPAIRDALPSARVSVHNTLSLIGMVRTGRWVTLLPQTVIRILPGQLAFRPVRGLQDTRLVSLLIRERTSVPRLTQDFKILLETFDFNHFYQVEIIRSTRPGKSS